LELLRERGVSAVGDRPLGWPAVLLTLLASHLAGDFLMQTEWQAVNKAGGLRESRSRKALLAHVLAYTGSFLPALAWIGSRTSVRRAVVVGGAVAIPHLLIDDGRLVEVWLREVKRAQQPPAALTVAVDQSFHVICLLGAAVVAAG
jgi:Protein of unknown function (DUF3307)